MRQALVVIGAIVLSGLGGFALGRAAGGDVMAETRNPRSSRAMGARGGEDAVRSRELNRLLVELWKMESLER